MQDRSASYLTSPELPSAIRFSTLVARTDIHGGLFVALLAVLATIAVFYLTPLGMRIRICGNNEHFAQYSGINMTGCLIVSQLLGGMLSGLGGAVEIMGNYERFNWIALTQYGFDGLMVAVLARKNPIFIPFGAFLLAYMRIGANVLNVNTSVPIEFVQAHAGRSDSLYRSADLPRQVEKQGHLQGGRKAQRRKGGGKVNESFHHYKLHLHGNPRRHAAHLRRAGRLHHQAGGSSQHGDREHDAQRRAVRRSRQRYTQSLVLGVLGGMVGGILIGLLISYAAFVCKTDLWMTCIAVNTALVGGTILVMYMITGQKTNTLGYIPSLVMPAVEIPLIKDIPVIGPILSGHNLFTYLSLVLLAAEWFLLYRTKIGLRIRAVGQNPQAAESVGIAPRKLYFISFIFSGIFASLGGYVHVDGLPAMFARRYDGGPRDTLRCPLRRLPAATP